MEVRAGDIRDRDSLARALRECDAVCHLAALIGIPYSYESPLAYLRTNIEGTYNVLESAREQGNKPVIHTSTSETYGSAQSVPIDESHPLVGQSPYSASKIGAEQLAISYQRSFGLPVTILKPFNTFGPRQSARAVTPSIMAQLLAGAERIALGNLTPTRDLTFVDDTCRAFLLALESGAGVGEVINLGVGKEIAIGALAERIIALSGRRAEVVSRDERKRPSASEVDRLCSDNAKARRLLGWQPTVELETGLRRTFDFVEAHLALYRPDVYAV